MTLETTPAIAVDTYPADLRECDRWLTWKDSDGRKIPRAPYAYPDQPDRYVDAQEPDVWTDFGTAREWAGTLVGFGLAYVIRDRDAWPGEDLVLVDYDDVRDPASGAVHPTVREHVDRAGSYADVSTSGTGVHVLCRGALPEGVQTITDELPPVDGEGGADRFPEAELEVYESARFVAMTGRHLAGTPAETRECQAFLDELAATYATVTAGRPDALRDGPRRSRADLAEMDATDDVQDVYDAIAQTRPADVSLRSPVTAERADGSRSLDPAWTHSESGTRLAEVDDRWIYRDGMIGLDALQVVALEEGIITDERDYPSGADFAAAVEALRARGAHIPRFEPGSGSGSGSRDGDGEGGERAVAGGRPPDVAVRRLEWAVEAGDEEQSDATGGHPVLDQEVELLRETVGEQRECIDELETALAEREVTIAALRATLAKLATDAVAGTGGGGNGSGGGDSVGADRAASASGPLGRVTGWLDDRLTVRERDRGGPKGE